MMEIIYNYFFISLPEFYILILWGAIAFGYRFSEIKYRLLFMAFISAIVSEYMWFIESVGDLRILITFLTLVIFYKIILDIKWNVSFIMALFGFITLLLSEISIVSIYLMYINYEQILSNFSYKLIVTISYLLPLMIGIFLLPRTNISLFNWYQKITQNKKITYSWIAVIFLISFQLLMIILLNYAFLLQEGLLLNKLIYSIKGLPIFSLILILTNFLLVLLIIKIIQFNTKKELYQTEINYHENMENLLKKLKMERHDFINELQTISGMAQANLYDHLDNYLSDIINGIRNVNRIINIKNIPVSAFLHTKVEQIESMGVKVNINVETSDTFQSVKGYDLVKVVSNLIDNALRAVKESSIDNPFIEIYWGKEESTAVIKISNNGPKIDRKVIDLLFEEGFSTKKNNENSGYGLFIVKSIVNKYKGMIEVESTDKLTSFIIKMPL